MNDRIDDTTLSLLAEKLLSLQNDVAAVLHDLFKNQQLLWSKIKLISEQLIRGQDKPTTCDDPLNIPYAIAEGTELGEYPLSYINYEIASTRRIEITIEAYFRDEKDTQFIFSFPCDINGFNKYMDCLKEIAIARELDLQDKENQKKIKKENEDRKTYEALKEKFEKKP